MAEKVEYRVRPVTRYVVTRFVTRYADEAMPFDGVGSSVIGEFANQKLAHSVCEAFSANSGEKVFHVMWEPMEEPPTALPTE